jgi:hypothetical protein
MKIFSLEALVKLLTVKRGTGAAPVPQRGRPVLPVSLVSDFYRRMALGVVLGLIAGWAVAQNQTNSPATASVDEAPRWIVPPRYEPLAGGARVVFELSRPADVEVAILDEQGTLVRRLAAGWIGGRAAAAPLQAASLTQRLDWDGRDDTGAPAQSGPFQARIRVGLRPVQEKVAGWDGQTLGDPILGLAVDKAGQLHVLTGDACRGRTEVRVFDGEGRYRRTILPYAAATPETRLASLGRIEMAGRRLPVVYHAQSRSLAPLTAGLRRQNMVVMPAGHLVMVGGLGSWFDHSGPRHLLALHPEGGAPDGLSFVGPQLAAARGLESGAGSGPLSAFDHLAASPDGRWIYLTLSTAGQSAQVVYRLDAERWNDNARLAPGMSKPFLGRPFEAGSEDGRLNDPQGLATDTVGNLYVCDRGNHRVAVFSAAGGELGKFDVRSPEQIVVHPRTGALYVLSRPRAPRGPSAAAPGEDGSETQEAPSPVAATAKILKFSPWHEAGVVPLAEIEGAFDLMAVDPVAQPTRIWVSMAEPSDSEGLFSATALLPITDRVNQFALGRAVTTGAGLRHPLWIAADPARKRVLVRDDEPLPAVLCRERVGRIRSLQIDTNELRSFIRADEAAVDRQGHVYAITVQPGANLARYRPTGEPHPFTNAPPVFPSDMSHPFPDPYLGEPRGLRVAPDGDLYLVRSVPWKHENGVYSRVDVWTASGELKHAGLVHGLGIGDGGIAVDRRGQIYLAANLRNAGTSSPPLFPDSVPDYIWTGWIGDRARRPFPWKYAMINAYRFNRGSVLCFGPAGGALYGRSMPWLLRDATAEAQTLSDMAFSEKGPERTQLLTTGHAGRPVRVKGLQWLASGVAPTPAMDIGPFDATGAGPSARLATDSFNRIYVPDVLLFSVVVLDAAGNALVRIGSYGNADDQRQSLRFAWPGGLDAAEDKLYVSDSLNRSVSVIGFEYGMETLCPLVPPPPSAAEPESAARPADE